MRTHRRAIGVLLAALFASSAATGCVPFVRNNPFGHRTSAQHAPQTPAQTTTAISYEDKAACASYAAVDPPAETAERELIEALNTGESYSRAAFESKARALASAFDAVIQEFDPYRSANFRTIKHEDVVKYLATTRTLSDYAKNWRDHLDVRGLDFHRADTPWTIASGSIKYACIAVH